MMKLRSRQGSQYRSSEAVADSRRVALGYAAQDSGDEAQDETNNDADDEERLLKQKIKPSQRSSITKSRRAPASGPASISTTTMRKRKRRDLRHSKHPKASKWQIISGFSLSIVLLVFISTVDFHDENKREKRRQKLKLLHFAESGLLNGGDSCMYDGHCPVHSSCAAAPLPSSTMKKGICEPILPLASNPGSTGSIASSACLQSCLVELKRDERYYHGSSVKVEWSENVKSQGRPDGCLVVYRRVPEQQKQPDNAPLLPQHGRMLPAADTTNDGDVFKDGIPSEIIEWVDQRFRHVKRVDPYSIDEDVKDDKWMAYCTSQCRSDADCATSNSVFAFVCDKGACVRNENHWKDNNNNDLDDNKPFVIVTAANVGYYRGLVNLAASARYWAPNHKLVVYNLGGLQKHFETIKSWSNVLAIEWHDGIPQEYPEHFKRPKTYAWKPIIVNETLHKYGSIFWMDAGSTITGPIDPMEQATRNTGIMLVKGQDDDMKQKSHADTYRWLGYDKASFQAGPHFSGNTQAFLMPSRYIETVVKPNAECALHEACIAPHGALLTMHRFDQTSISILAYAPKIRLPHYTEFLAAHRNQINPDLAKPSYKFVWTSRMTNKYYAEHDPESSSINVGKNVFEMHLNDANAKVDAIKEQANHLAAQEHKQEEADKAKQNQGGDGALAGLRARMIKKKQEQQEPKVDLAQQLANEQVEMARHNQNHIVVQDDGGVDDDPL